MSTGTEGKAIRIDGTAVAKAVREGVKAEIAMLTSSGVIAEHGTIYSFDPFISLLISTTAIAGHNRCTNISSGRRR